MSSVSEDEEEASDLLYEGEKLTQLLFTYQERIHTVVSDWLEHYRDAIGIQPRMQLISTTSTSRTHTRAASSRARAVRSSMSYAYG